MKITRFYPFFAIALIALFTLSAYVTPTQAAPGVQAASTPAPTASPTVAPPALPDLPIPRYVRPAYANGSRSADGKPGPNYWQNDAVHDITIEVAPPGRTITGTATITYTNNSPNPMPFVVFRLYQNVRKPEAQRELDVSDKFFNDGIQIDEFGVNGEIVPWSPLPLPYQTVKLVTLPEPLAPGESATFSFKWQYDLGLEYNREGTFDPTTFFLGYFFPRLSAYSDADAFLLAGIGVVPGWDFEEYTYKSGRELNNDFGDFIVNVKAPKDFLVWATGALQNPDEVLQPEYAQRLAEAQSGDKVIKVASPDELKQGVVTVQEDTVTWTFKAENVPDVAVALSDHYNWDASSVVVDPKTGRRANVNAAYADEHTDFKSMADDIQDILTFVSTKWPGVPWPYDHATVFVGGGDEEFVMMANDSAEASEGASVRFVAAHELLHNYFPFYMGIDERRYPFMDEGWTTAFEYLFNLEDSGKAEADKIFIKLRSGNLVGAYPGADIPIITPADTLRGQPVSRDGYDKAALAYLSLKELMGDKAFGEALHEFMARWNGKRPLPWDMFGTFNDVSDQDLNWFFTNWFYSQNYLDIAVGEVEVVDGGYAVQVNNPGGFAIPFNVKVKYADGAEESFHQNPGIWKDDQGTATVKIVTTKEITSVTLDGGIFVDNTPKDNTWASQPPAEATPAPTPTPGS